MVFKQSKPANKKGKVLFIDGSSQVRVGRAQNYLDGNHVSQLFDWYKEFKDVEIHAKLVSLKNIAENDYNLNILYMWRKL